MKDKSVKIQASMWKDLAQFASLATVKPWNEIAQDMGLAPEEARHIMMAWQEAQNELQSRTGENEEVFQAWDLVHWCQITQLLEDVATRSDLSELRSLTIPLLKQQRQHPAYSVYVQLRQRWQELSTKAKPQLVPVHDEFTDHAIHLIEDAVFEKDTLLVEGVDGRIRSLIPCRVIFLEGKLSLIAEESQDHSLLAIEISEIVNIKRDGKVKAPRAGIHEVSEFVRALRTMSDNEVRLVLKIRNPDLFVLMPDYHFLGKPCIVTNAEGDLIWAAWVEPCDELFEWLSTMDGQVEILEPSEFVLDYAVYCEEKLGKLA